MADCRDCPVLVGRDPTDHDETCQVFGDEVKIQTSGKHDTWLNLHEVIVNEGAHNPPKLTASMNYQYSGSYPASNCIDGNPNTMCHANVGGWLSVKLDKPTCIERLKVVNRIGCCTHRIVGGNIKIFNQGTQVWEDKEAFPKVQAHYEFIFPHHGHHKFVKAPEHQGTCTCTMTSDNDIDYVYVDGVDVTKQVTNYNDLGNWPTNNQLTFECNDQTLMAVQASDGNGGFGAAGCNGGGFGMYCTSTNTNSPWDKLSTDNRWKAWGARCTSNPCKYGGRGDDKNTYIPPAPENWFAKDFDDSAWKQADKGNQIGERTGASQSICSMDGPGWLFRSPDFA